MNVHIGELNTTVRTVDSEALLSPQVLAQITSVVLQAVREKESHQERVDNERRVTGGVYAETEGWNR